MKTNRRGFFQTFAAAATGTLVPTAAATVPVVDSVVKTVKTITLQIDGEVLAKTVLSELPRVARMQGLR